MLAVVLITPLEYDSNIVELKCRKGLNRSRCFDYLLFIHLFIFVIHKESAEFIGYTESQVLSDEALPVYVRQLAMHANVSVVDYIL